MAEIKSFLYKGKKVFRVECVEPVTKSIPADPPYDRDVLQSAVEVCEGAASQQIGYEHISHPMDFGDERYDFILEVSEHNILCLQSTEFVWSDDALEMIADCKPAEEAVQTKRKELLMRLEEKKREILALINSLRKPST